MTTVTDTTAPQTSQVSSNRPNNQPTINPKITPTFSIKTFDDLTNVDVYHILRARSKVFVVEQDCVYQDMDDIDFDCLHLVAHKHGVLVGYCRILPPSIDKDAQSNEPNVANKTSRAAGELFIPKARIGRVLVLPLYRNNGLARQLMQEAINYCQSNYSKYPIAISAQSYLIDFYQSLGFEVKGGAYLDHGIEHIDMQLPAKKSRFGALRLFKRRSRVTTGSSDKKGGSWLTWMGVLLIILGIIFIAGLIYIMPETTAAIGSNPPSLPIDSIID